MRGNVARFEECQDCRQHNQRAEKRAAMFFLHLHNQGINVSQIFWGVWLLPLALLIYRSRFLPRFVAVWVAINGFAYVAMTLAVLLFPQYAGRVSNILFPALTGELVLMLWLVIRGAKGRGQEQESKEQRAESNEQRAKSKEQEA